VEIIEEYRGQINTIISEPDSGQYQAINKGMALARGDVMAWLNADDLHFPWTLEIVGEIFEQYCDVEWITGQPAWFNEKGQCVRLATNDASYPQGHIARGLYRGRMAGFLQQESMFWRRRLWKTVGGLNTEFGFAADYELWTRFARHAELVPVAVPLGGFRRRPGSQRSDVGRLEYESEVVKVAGSLPKPPLFWRLAILPSQVIPALLRWLRRYRTPLIVYDGGTGEWEIVNTRRSLSRASLQALITEWHLRRRKR
jgi:glycosyltransferase involved in cell wall biosynthesis